MSNKLYWLTCSLCAGWLFCGCGRSDVPTAPVATPQAAPLSLVPDVSPEPLSAPTLDGAAAAPDPVQPSASQASGDMSQQTLLLDDDGEPIQGGSLAILQRAVDIYSDLRFSSVEGDAEPWPELRDFSQLIQRGIVKKLPDAPPGQKFVMDAKTKKVALVRQ
jgi:hypothetical protein